MVILQAVLTPCIDPNETLEPGRLERPAVSFLSSDDGVTLGRSSLTGIADPNIPREVVRMNLDLTGSSALNVQVMTSPSAVHINGTPLLSSQARLLQGDVISLSGLRYEYKVRIGTISSFSTAADAVASQNSTTATAAAVLPALDEPDESLARQKPIALDTSPSPAVAPPVGGLKSTGEDNPQQQRVISDSSSSCDSQKSSSLSPPPDNAEATCIQLPMTVAKRLVEEVQCSVCLDIQVFPRTFQPCGHSLCSPCVANLQQCPQCRQPVETHAPSRELENLISTLVTVPGLFDPYDVAHFHQRQKKHPKLVSFMFISFFCAWLVLGMAAHYPTCLCEILSRSCRRMRQQALLLERKDPDGTVHRGSILVFDRAMHSEPQAVRGDPLLGNVGSRAPTRSIY